MKYRTLDKQEIDWMCEVSYDWEVYTDLKYSKDFIKNYLTREEFPYLCLHDCKSDENIKVVGFKNQFIIEGMLEDENSMLHNIVLGKQRKTDNTISIKNIPKKGDDFTVFAYEVFSLNEVIVIFENFYKGKYIERSLAIQRKKHLF